MTYLDYDFGIESYGITITHIQNNSLWILYKNGGLMQVIGSNNLNESALYVAKTLLKEWLNNE